jgi:DNA mismatch repair protein MutL
MGKIRLLDESTIKMIAAGEIIERPASVVKELVENSLDADASNITVEIANGGKDYIRVTDDGEGLLEEDLPLAFKRHSTSKIEDAEDLYNILSFGFRGEALASISTVAKVEVLTKTKDNMLGVQAFVEEGKIIEKKPVGCPKGTTMIIRDLFYNIPVRKKFLKSDKTEANFVDDIMYKLALGNSHISFKYVKDNKVVFKTTKNNILSNIYTLLGKDFYENLIKIDYLCENFKIYGYISNNTFYRGNRKHQYLYVNRRYVNNRDITTLIEQKYNSLIPVNRFPVFIIFIDIKPSFIDVNIHPTKQEIKFINQQEIMNALDETLSTVLTRNLYIQKIDFNNKEEHKNSLPLLYDLDKKQRKNSIYNFSDSIHNKTVKEETTLNELTFYANNNDFFNNKKDETKELSIDDNNNINKNNFLDEVKIIGVLFSTYVLMEDSKSNKLLIMDLMKIACTNAIKSGDKITDIEIKSLIEQLKNTENPYTCPHGRPTIVEISKKDIEKEFRRIM